MILWRASVNGPGKRPWFVWRIPAPLEPMTILSDARGRYIRFASREAAQRVADRENLK